jgi:DNA-binding NarL/FixJ family response regulator
MGSGVKVCAMTATVLAPAAFAPDRTPRPRLELVGQTQRAQGPRTGEIRVLIAHGQTLVRAGLRSLLEGGSISVLGEAGGGDDAVTLARRMRPDVVLMDATLPGLDAVEAIKQMATIPELRVIMLTAANADEIVFTSLRAGVRGFLAQDTEPAELVRAVRLVARGEAHLSPSVAGRLIAEYVSQPDIKAPSNDLLEELTNREREVVALVARGLTNQEIGEQLVVTPGTAKTHVSRAMVKLHARDRAQLVVIAYEAGLASPGAASRSLAIAT